LSKDGSAPLEKLARMPMATMSQTGHISPSLLMNELTV